MIKAKIFACLGIITIAGLSCAIPGQTAATEFVIPSPAQAAIDLPKDGDVIPLAPYEIVYHGSDFTEVTQLELSINSVPITIQANPAPGTGFVLLRYIWTPPAAGTYLIQSRAQNQEGEWGPTTYITVTVEPSTVVVQPTLEDTISPPITIYKTPMPTQTAQIVNLGGDGVFTSIVKSNDWIFYGGDSCGEREVSFSVSMYNFFGIRYVFAFVRLDDKASSEMTDWNDGKPMTKTNSGNYVTTITMSDIPDYSSFDEAWLWYQFVIQKPDGGYIRSKVYSDITLEKCP
jgi:hypothetical protein